MSRKTKVQRTWRVLLCGAVVLAAAGRPAGANGSVTTTDATIAAGAAPTQGAVTIDDCAPQATAPAPLALTPLGAIGTMTGSLPTFPGGGTGADGAFHATTSQSLAGGTFNYTSYLVDNGVTVTYTGPVTILATGNVTVRGNVVTTAGSAPIDIRCAGEFVVDGSPSTASVATTGSSSPVTIHAGRSFNAGVNDGVSAAIGDVTVTAYGTAAATGDVNVTGGYIEDSAGPGVGEGTVTVVAARSVNVSGNARVGSVDDPLIVQAFGGDVTVSDNSYLNSRDAKFTVEASGDMRVSGNSYMNSQDGEMFVTAFGGDVTADGTGGNSFFNTRDGDALLRASGSVILENGAATATSLNGTVTLIAFGGDVGIDDGDARLTTFGTAIARASGDVRCAGRVESRENITIEALGGKIALSGDGHVRASVAGNVDLRAATRIEVRQRDGGNAFIDTTSGAGDVSLSAGAGGIDLDLSRVESDAGGISMVTSGPLTVTDTSEGDTARIAAPGAISLVSATGGIRVADTSITTGNQPAGPGITNSGAILIESFGGKSFGGATGAIDASGATIRSGTSDDASGSVTLRVHVSDAVPSTKSFFLPTIVKLKLKGEGKDSLVAAGVFDDGGASVNYDAPVTIDVGGFSETFSLTPNKKGTQYKFKSPTLALSVRPDRVVERGISGSSRGAFRMKISKSSLNGRIPLDGAVEFHFAATGLPNASGIVVVESGKYKLGRKRGTLTSPGFLPKRLKAKISDSKPDKVSLLGGFATTGDTPQTLGTVRVAVGTEFALEIAGDRFTRRGDVWTFRESATGRSVKVVVDFLRGQVTVSTKGVEAGGLLGATTDILFESGAGGPAVVTTVVLSQPKASLRVY